MQNRPRPMQCRSQTSTLRFGFMDRRERCHLTSFVGLCVLGAAIIVWLTMPAASAASTQVAPLSPMQEKALKTHDTFKECANCPEMVVVPAGSFRMGSPASEPMHSAD